MTKLPDNMPLTIAKLPMNRVGYPIPWFVHINDLGVEDFRVIRRGGIGAAVTRGLCWICGEPRSGMDAFVIGPMCAVNRTSAEPPSHLACARWAAVVCPFLANPTMVRREHGLPEARDVAGHMIARNPGVTLVWKTRTGDWQPFGDGSGGVLFDVGSPRGVEWFAQGRTATRAEVLASIDSGLPLLAEQAQDEGADALAELDRLHSAALALVPA